MRQTPTWPMIPADPRLSSLGPRTVDCGSLIEIRQWLSGALAQRYCHQFNQRDFRRLDSP
ncbi:hypothetical protein COCC4DRAFT_33565, partial [Bipolaris maydis ATCC 48331]